jgi:hypothetical protein
MPRILVTTDAPDGHEAVLLQQRVVPADLETDQLCARLVERVGWALVDADEVEQGTTLPAAVARTRRARSTARGRLSARPRPGRSSARGGRDGR